MFGASTTLYICTFVFAFILHRSPLGGSCMSYSMTCTYPILCNVIFFSIMSTMVKNIDMFVTYTYIGIWNFVKSVKSLFARQIVKVIVVQALALDYR